MKLIQELVRPAFALNLAVKLPFILVLFFLILPLSYSTAQQVEWINPTEHDFGDIPHKEPVKIDFRFRNTSGQTMTIDNVRTSCGCTAPDWSFEPLPTDSIGLISVQFDAKKPGYFRKKIKVYLSGISKAQVLWVEGWVE